MKRNLLLIAACALLAGCTTTAGWLERIDRAGAARLTTDQIIAGLKEAFPPPISA